MNSSIAQDGENNGTQLGRILRDKCGCFLGVFTLEGALELWPDAKDGGSIIVVPRVADFKEALASISLADGVDILLGRPQYKRSILEAQSFIKKHKTDSAISYWSSINDKSMKIICDDDRPIAMATPRLLRDSLGDSWFFVNDGVVQVVTYLPVSLVQQILKKDSGEFEKVDLRVLESFLSACDSEGDGDKSTPILPEEKIKLNGEPLKCVDDKRRGATSALSKGPNDKELIFAQDASDEVKKAALQVMNAARNGKPFMLLPILELACKRGDFPRHTADSLVDIVTNYAEGFKPEECEAIIQCVVAHYKEGKKGSLEKQRQDSMHNDSRLNEEDGSRRKEVLASGMSVHIHVNEFLVRRSFSSHSGLGHALQEVRAAVCILPKDGGDIVSVGFTAYWCEKCRLYYMRDFQYRELKAIGTICCRVVEERAIRSQTGEPFDLYDHMSGESLLHEYGYNVNKQNDLSPRERRDIISFVIENEILTVNQVADHLQMLISQRKYRCYMEEAVEKWESDLRWVCRYHSPTRRVRVDSIYAKVYQ